jgi:hypothetical protein
VWTAFDKVNILWTAFDKVNIASMAFDKVNNSLDGRLIRRI